LQDLGHPWTSLVKIVFINTDPFIMISGLLTSYNFYKQLEQTKRLDVPREYVSRLMRYSTELCVKNVSRLMKYSTELCVKYVSRLMRYSTELCVKNVSRLMRYSTEFCVKYVFRLIR
jgi:CRISPR/Cas system endoribonuclease Cas6 (RAMP superfamily)